MIKVNAVVGGVVKTNCYVAENEKKECLVVDIADFSGEKVAEFVKSKGLTPLAILLTHGHFDHYSGIDAFKEVFPLDVYGNIFDDKKKSRFSDKINSYVTKFISDGDILRFRDFEVKVLHTPGHSAGSLCYVIGDCIFSGDTLFAGDIGRTDFEDGSKTAMRESMRKLNALTGDFKVYPGHGASTTLNAERKNNPYMRF